VFENKVLRRISGPKREKAEKGWRRLHNEELRNLYASPKLIKMRKSRVMRWTGHVTRMGNAYNILVRKPEGKRRPRHRWEDNIRMNLGEIGREGVAWMHLAQDTDGSRDVMTRL
jgi:hypothetical protein